ncbi:uncharacterized protein LOC126549165 [Aphis gossypii]|uniref:uncharacterized protein LOC126549165 n=1 Tax=Aphis gossypii TaxID=80765 RepID=UPI0021595826|nr:uncharacterized protein LOC126549165 [Aphis gossypii]
MNSLIKEKVDVPMIYVGLGLDHGQSYKAKHESEYVIILINYYTEEHRKNIKLNSDLANDDKFFKNYRYLTVERGKKLARAIVELLIEDAKLCRCGNLDESSSYSEVMTVFEAGARIAFKQLYSEFNSDFLQWPVVDIGRKSMEKLSTRQHRKYFSWMWFKRVIGKINGNHSDQKNEKPATMPKRMQVKYIKNIEYPCVPFTP